MRDNKLAQLNKADEKGKPAMHNKIVLVLSGGMDSVTLLYQLSQNKQNEVFPITFDYGQRHVREIDAARGFCDMLDLTHKIVDVSGLRDVLGGSALTDDIDVPDGHYEEESMRVTVVPNRNMIMMSIAWGYAASIGAHKIALAVHAGDHFIYPDCRPDFIKSAKQTLRLATKGMDFEPRHVFAPYLKFSKREIAQVGFKLNPQVPYEDTWTCYKGGDIHCGICGSCTERREALLGYDYTKYADNHYHDNKLLTSRD
jgi:7-cyano-7-deazaguanine synthase